MLTPTSSANSVVAPPLLFQKEQLGIHSAPGTPSTPGSGHKASGLAAAARSSSSCATKLQASCGQKPSSTPGASNTPGSSAKAPAPERIPLRQVGSRSDDAAAELCNIPSALPVQAGGGTPCRPVDENAKATGGRIIQPENPPRRPATGGEKQSAASATSVDQQTQARNAKQQQQQQHRMGGAQKPARGQDPPAPVLSQAPKTQQPKDPADEVGHFIVTAGDWIDRSPDFPDGRYKVLKQLGSGTYGKVVLCEDRKYQGAKVAVKLVRTQHLYRVSAKNEIKILRELDGNNCTIKLLRDFEHNGHVSMSFELLGTSIDNVCRDRPMKLEHVRDVAMQLLQALAYSHSKKIIHSDVKTENVLLVSQSDSAMFVKLVDFGSALYSTAWHPPLVGTMHYRAPEAVLQAGWSFGIDIWAVGCIIVELLTGRQLFQLAHDDVHLAMMERVLGPVPSDLIQKGFAKANQYNRGLIVRDSRGNVKLAPCRPEGNAQIRGLSRLEALVQDHTLLHLVKRMMCFDPDRRITARDALLHPFFEVSCAESDDEIDVSKQSGHSPALQPPSIKMPNTQRLIDEDAGAGTTSTPNGLSRASTAGIICAPPRPPSPGSVSSGAYSVGSEDVSVTQEHRNPAPGLLPRDAKKEVLKSTGAVRHEVLL